MEGHLFHMLAPLFDLLHLLVRLLLVVYCLFSRLQNQIIDFSLLLLNFIPDLPIMINAMTLVPLVDELLGLSRLVKLVSVFVLFGFHLVIVLLFYFHFGGFDMMDLRHEICPLIGIVHSLGSLLLFLPQLNYSGFYFCLLVLGHFEMVKGDVHFVLGLHHHSTHSPLKMLIWSIHLTVHTDIHLRILVILEKI